MDQKEDLDTDLMATYRSIPCSAFHSKSLSLDRDHRTNNWTMKLVITQVLVKYNNVCMNKEWIMDLKDQDPPTNPIAMAAVQKAYTKANGKTMTNHNSGSTKGNDRDKNWNYTAPKAGEAETKYVKKADRSKEKCLWCGHEQCKCWTLSHTTVTMARRTQWRQSTTHQRLKT
jgi:hypothetical protein